MAPKDHRFAKSKGAWTEEEDQKLSQYIKTHGEKRWRSVAVKAGLNRCGKSCRLRWLNYLRPDIKRGNISDQEEDLIIRLHKLLGNRWALIAGRLPGRTDNEIKNYWNSHLSKRLKTNQQPQTSESGEPKITRDLEKKEDTTLGEMVPSNRVGTSDTQLDVEKFLNFSDDQFTLPSPMVSSYSQQFKEGCNYMAQGEALDYNFDFGLDLDFSWVNQLFVYDDDMGDYCSS